MNKQYLAVYGTLKRGYGNNYLMEMAGMPFAGTGSTAESSFFLQGGGFPICRDGGNQRVAVEVFEFDSFDDIVDIDHLEGHPDWYVRRQVPVELDTGETVSAWMYIQEPLSDVLRTNMLDQDTISISNEGVAAWNL